MGEQNRPGVTNPLVEADRSLGRQRVEIWSRLADLKCHGSDLSPLRVDWSLHVQGSVQSIAPITCVSSLRYQSQGASDRSSSRLQAFDAHEIVPDAHLKRANAPTGRSGVSGSKRIKSIKCSFYRTDRNKGLCQKFLLLGKNLLIGSMMAIFGS
jgi:hypothetical protein